MATGKSGTSINYVSKGQRRNVSRQSRLDLAADHRANPSLKDMLKRLAYREEIIRHPRSAHDKVLADRYLEEDRVELQAWKLIDQYREVGLTKASAVHAVKTNYVEHLHSKWSPILKAHQEEKKKK